MSGNIKEQSMSVSMFFAYFLLQVKASQGNKGIESANQYLKFEN